MGPTGLHDESGEVADGLDNGELAGNEGTGILGGDVAVEVGVGVASNNVNDAAELAHAAVGPGGDDIGGGVRTRVAAGAELGLDGGDEGLELVDGAETVEDGLVGDDNELDDVPVAPGLDGGDLVGDIGRAVVAADLTDEDAEDDLETVGLAGGTDVGEGVAVGRVDTDGGEASVLDVGDIGHDIRGALAVTAGGVRSVGDSPLATVATERSRGLSSRLGRSRRSRGGGGSGSRGAGSDRSEGAVDNGIGLDNGGDRRSSVGARRVGGDDRNRADGGGVGHDNGDGSDGVGTGRGADVGGGLNDAGHGGALGLGGGVGADDGGGGLDDGRDTSNGVGTLGERGGGSSADHGSLGHDDGAGREGVRAGGRAGLRSRRGHDGGRRRGGDRGRRGGGRGGLAAAGDGRRVDFGLASC